MAKLFYTAIDVGESLTKLVKVSILNEKMHVCATYCAQTKGIRNGEIYSKSEVQSTISQLIAKATVNDEYPIDEVILLLPSNKTNIYKKKIECYIKGEVVNENDIKFLHTSIVNKLENKNEIVVQTLTSSYYVDGEKLGPNSINGCRAKTKKIGLEALLVTLPYNTARGLVNILEDMGITVLDAIPSPIAHASLLLKPEEYDSGALIVDLGGEGCNISLYKNNLFLQHVRVPKGINTVINDLMRNYNIDYKYAAQILEKYGSATLDGVKNYNVIETQYDHFLVKESDVATFVNQDLEIVINEIKKTIDLIIQQNPQVPLIITGYGAHIRNIELLFKQILGIECYCRMYQRIGGRNHQYTTCIGGLVTYLSRKGIINIENV